MQEYDVTELAYKNGFEAGKASATKCGTWEAMYDTRGRITGWIHKYCGRVTIEASKYCPVCGAQMSLQEK